MKVWRKVFIAVLLPAFMLISTAFAQDKAIFDTAPTKNNGKKWRIGYYEGGEFIEYPNTLMPTVNALISLGWIEKSKIPPSKGANTSEIWKWLSENTKSQYIEFVADAHYSAKWDNALRKKTAAKIIKRLKSQKDIDLMIAMGTKAAQDIANNQHDIPTIVLAASDPIASHIIKSTEDSGIDNVHARVDPYRYERQLRIFHDIIGFKKLGISYRNDISGRSYSAVDKVEAIAKERGFEIVHCFIDPEQTAIEAQGKNMIECFKELSKKVDAIYVTGQVGVNAQSIPTLVEIANSSQIPTFSQSGSDQVRYGFLMSISQAGFKYIGQFHAETIAKIFNGAKPRQINQLFEDPPKIAINLKTAEIIGYDPPVDVLGASDEIYQDIVSPE
ncbi:ABC transporter substrate binding protein [Desulfobacterales bacterium HSG16]|nr:ABC transporter substrate binding protein [Desulfobacterales bacterium HSG16]